MSKPKKEKVSNLKKMRDPEFKSTLKRIISMLFEFYPKKFTVVIVCTIIATSIAVIPAMFMEKALTIIGKYWQNGNWDAAQGPIFKLTVTLAIAYSIAIFCDLISSQFMATITQGSLMKIRNKMFTKMESLPISYFDTNAFGDIMSHYTNDVDSLRQLIANSITGILMGTIGIVGVSILMLYYSVWMTLIVFFSAIFMFWSMGALGSRSGKYFKLQQDKLGVTEGFVEEAMSGQRTIKVFSHEDEIKKQFDELNDELYRVSKTANRYSELMPPVLFNMGNIAYVVVALAGSIFLYYKTSNLSISGLPLSIATVIPFLNMTKQFVGQFSNITANVNQLIRGVAGAKRVFELIDEESETDEGRVVLVNATLEDGNIEECTEKTCTWAWKYPHSNGDVEYRQLAGDIRLENVDFGYTPDHTVLHDISLYAKPGQKVAFVGATGAGKTTITNLINRFYDINGGKIRYDGINIEKIKKPDLRRSLGMVLQDTNLFSTTVMENIRFGNLKATDEQCIEAAKLAGADSFITRLPEGYDTKIVNNGSNLSQGQRQLISIARAAVANPPVMILDEATSSIDTRTEALVQRGMDNLMDGRTTFVIAHRLSTVRNSDVICVLDHGRIIERGTHDQLLEKHGTYYQLYTGAFELK